MTSFWHDDSGVPRFKHNDGRECLWHPTMGTWHPLHPDGWPLQPCERAHVTCNVCWGSHGCDREAGHDGQWHVCGSNLRVIVEAGEVVDDGGPCSRARVTEDGYSEWEWAHSGEDGEIVWAGLTPEQRARVGRTGPLFRSMSDEPVPYVPPER